MSKQNFIYKDLDGLIDIDTLSPSREFYYQVQKPVSINMSNFAAKIAFFDIEGSLIYYRHKVLAHWLEPWQQIELVKWSVNGYMCYFFEYERNAVYESVFLNLKDQYCYRIDEAINNFEIIHSFNLKDRCFNEDVIVSKFESLNFKREEVKVDNISKQTFLQSILVSNKWHPSL